MKLPGGFEHCLAMAVVLLLFLFPLVSPLNDEGTTFSSFAGFIRIFVVFWKKKLASLLAFSISGVLKNGV
jgi:hypothetical protein